MRMRIRIAARPPARPPALAVHLGEGEGAGGRV